MSRTGKSGLGQLSEISSGHRRRGTQPSRLGALVHKIVRNQRDYGWHITLQKALAQLVRGVYFHQVYRIYRINLAARNVAQDDAGSPFYFQLLTPQDLDKIAQVEQIAEWLHGRVRQNLEAGQLCLVALLGDNVAGFNLINLTQASLILVNLRVKLRPGSAWSEHIAVQKEFRRSGLGAQLRYRIFTELKSRGVRRLYGGTLRSNQASLELTRSVGFKEIGDVEYRKILSFEKWRFMRIRG